MTMKTVYQESLERCEAELQDARSLVECLYKLLEEVGSFLSDRADYDMNEAGNYVPCNDEARLLQELADAGVVL